MEVLIPTWFYGFDSAIYFASALIGFVLSFFFLKIRSLSSERKHEFLYFGFLILSIGLLAISVTGLYSYLVLNKCTSPCLSNMLDMGFSVEDFSYIMYFGFSLISYTLFIFAYTEYGTRLSKAFILAFLGYLFVILALLTVRRDLSVWYSYGEYFHLTALIMTSFVAFRTGINYDSKKNMASFLVMAAFVFIAFFHLLYLFSSIDQWAYVLAHVSLLSSFVMLLLMMVKVRNR